MANAKEIKERMASIEETRKITNAMYLISSSKMKQAKKKLADTEPFFYAMQAEIARILRHVPDMHSHGIIYPYCIFIPDFLINLINRKNFSLILHQKQ